jgi:hypothetical protein
MLDVVSLTDLPSPTSGDYLFAWRGINAYRLNLSYFDTVYGKLSAANSWSGVQTFGNELFIANSSGSVKGRLGIGTYTGDASILGFGLDGGGSVNKMSFRPNGAEAMRLDDSQRVGIGTTSPGCKAAFYGGVYEMVAATQGGSEAIDWPTAALSLRRFDDFSKMTILHFGYVNDSPYLTDSNASWNFSLLDASGTGNRTTSSSSTILSLRGPGDFVVGAGALRPYSDNATGLGSGSLRWTTVYAATGSINTSDERDKTWRGALTDAELAAAKQIAAELGFYQWNDAIAEKGADGARYHFGARAQRCFAIMEQHGLDWRRYAWCCHDAWDEITEDVLEPGKKTFTKTVQVAVDTGLVGPDDQPIFRFEDQEVSEEKDWLVPTGEKQVTRAAGDRYGIRPDQLALFLIAAQEARLAALEAQMPQAAA